MLRTVSQLDGTPFPATASLAGRWARGRVHHDAGLETTYCAEVVARTYTAMGLLDPDRPTNYYDPGNFWSGDGLDAARRCSAGGGDPRPGADLNRRLITFL